MNRLRIFADFHNADAEGRLRLNCIGTIEDLSQHNVTLQGGQALTLYSEDLEVEGTVQYSEEEKIWVAAIDWNQVKQIEYPPVSRANRVNQLVLDSLNFESKIRQSTET